MERQKFIKSPDKKWRPYYEKHNSAGAKMGGRFSAEKNKKKRGPLKIVSKEELHDFIQEQRNGKENIRVSLSDILIFQKRQRNALKIKQGLRLKGL